MPDHPRHSLFEDIQGLFTGAALCALGLQFLTYHGLVTGQTAGLAVLLSYLTNWAFGPIFFVLNLPFYWLGYRRIGLWFTIKSFLSVALMSLLSMILPQFLTFSNLHPLVAALSFGLCTGVGLLAIFRHGGSLGGIGILGLIIQEKTGFRAGWFQMCFDAVLFMAAAFTLPLDRLLWSLLGVVVLNITIAVNHRRDYYVAT